MKRVRVELRAVSRFADGRVLRSVVSPGGDKRVCSPFPHRLRRFRADEQLRVTVAALGVLGVLAGACVPTGPVVHAPVSDHFDGAVFTTSLKSAVAAWAMFSPGSSSQNRGSPGPIGFRRRPGKSRPSA